MLSSLRLLSLVAIQEATSASMKPMGVAQAAWRAVQRLRNQVPTHALFLPESSIHIMSLQSHGQ